jgi:hypothetical protein
MEISTTLRGMIDAFDRLSRIAPAEVVGEMDAIVRSTFEETQALVPADEGDHRRPGGALKASGVVTSHMAGEDEWHAEITYGTNDDTVPYAQWALTRDAERGNYWMAPTYAAEEAITRVIEHGFEP